MFEARVQLLKHVLTRDQPCFIPQLLLHFKDCNRRMQTTKIDKKNKGTNLAPLLLLLPMVLVLSLLLVLLLLAVVTLLPAPAVLTMFSCW